jgi:hypothetical protein
MPSSLRQLYVHSAARTHSLLALAAAMAGVCSWLVYWFGE